MLVLGVLRVKVNDGTWSNEGKSTCWYLEY